MTHPPPTASSLITLNHLLPALGTPYPLTISTPFYQLVPFCGDFSRNMPIFTTSRIIFRRDDPKFRRRRKILCVLRLNLQILGVFTITYYLLTITSRAKMTLDPQALHQLLP